RRYRNEEEGGRRTQEKEEAQATQTSSQSSNQSNPCNLWLIVVCVLRSSWLLCPCYYRPMTLEEIIIAVVRILGSLPVLWWPFPGAIIAMVVDLSDLFMMNLIHLGGVRDYQSFDKYLDQVYMATFLIVS